MKVPYLNGHISYRASGQGPAIVFIHGFLESARIWRAFAYKLSSRFRVIRVNLPGHGGSSVFQETHSMELMAAAVHTVLKKEGIDKAMIVGHSMGGYVSLAFAEQWPEMINGLVMFSTSSYADTKARKIERDKAMEDAEATKMKYVSSVIPHLFHERTGNKASKKIYKLVKLAGEQSTEGIVTAIKGMKQRKDRSDVLNKSKFPTLFLAGRHDLLIQAKKVEEMQKNTPGSSIHWLERSGHFGFIEQRKESMEVIRNFAIEKIL